MRLAIIGAGLAGLAAARRLRQLHPTLDITCYEKSRGLGGRCATRRRAGFTFDHGAQYLKAPSDAVQHLIAHELPSEALHDIGLPVWVFDGAGTISEGDPRQNAEPKWVYRDGMNRLGKLLAEGLSIEREVRVGRLERTGMHWTLYADSGQVLGNADLVLLTPPAEQTAAILQASDLPNERMERMVAELSNAHYRRCLSFALAYDRPIMRPYYAVVNTDRQHPISWLAFEHRKHPERCPPGQSLLLPQMAAQWSHEHWEAPLETLTPLITTLVGELLAEEVDDLLWCDMHRWRYALPDAGADPATLHALGAPHGLFFAGDYTIGQGRLHRAIESGWAVAERISERITG